MNKFVLNLPKPMLKNYVLKHFAELTIDDFFEIMNIVDIPSYYYSKNKELNTNSNVLEFALSKEPSAFAFFDIDAFNNSCIDKISKVNNDLTPNQILDFPILLTHKDICKQVLKKYPFLIKKVDEEMVDDEIIEILENTYYNPDEEDFLRINKLLKSENLRIKAVLNNPNIIAKIPLTERIVNEIIKNNILPSRDWFYLNPKLKEYPELLEFALKNDPNAIIFFNENFLTPQAALYAVKKGFVPTEEDLLFNPDLCTSNYIMQVAIKNDPSLIRYIGKNCYLKFEDLEFACKKYKLTKEDLKNNPVLCGMMGIMINYPEFRLYSQRLTNEEKTKEIIKCLKENESFNEENLPFLNKQYNGDLNYKKLNKLVNKLNIDLDESKLSTQKKYYNILNILIENITNVRYEKEKSTFKYSNIVSLNNDILKKFELVKNTNDKNILDIFSTDIENFCGFILNKEYIAHELNMLYSIFINKGKIDLNETSEFCNKVLNEHRNSFKSSHNQMILEGIGNKLKLTNKKQETIENGVKLLKIATLIKEKKYDELGISYDEYNNLLNNLIKEILKNKDIKKLKPKVEEDNLLKLREQFDFKGFINEDDIYYTLQIKNSDSNKYIINKFERLKKSFTNKIKLKDADLNLLEREKLKISGISYSNFIIANKEKIYENISKILLNLNEEKLNKILSNKHLDEVLYLIPLVDLVSDLDIDAYINILLNYDRVRNKISSANNFNIDKDLSSQILKNINDLILLSNAYSSVDDIMLLSLGKEIVNEVGEHHAFEYLEFYKRMLCREYGYIPPVKCENDNYKLESGVYSDEYRLLIGKKPSKDSCIDLVNNAGIGTFDEVLLENTGDVVLVRNKFNTLISRIFLIRRGNVVQLITRSAENFDISLQKEIADQIIKKSIENDDNIEYVFLNKNSYMIENHNYKTIDDVKFKQLFGHADIWDSAILLSSKAEILGESNDNIKLNFNKCPAALYKKQRKSISYNPLEEEITRLRALYIYMLNSGEEKENLSRNFEPFYIGDYKKVVCGEDWYIAQKKDGTLEELILNTHDENKYLEISNVKKEFFELELEQKKK